MDDEILSCADDEPDNDEDLVGEHTFKDVNLILNLSSGNHVEDVQKDKYVKDNCEMSGWTVLFNQGTVKWLLTLIESSINNCSIWGDESWVLRLFWNPEVASKSNNENNDGLIEGHT